MKKLILSFLIASSLSVFAQVPQGISYQAVALNGAGQAVANGNVGVRLSILDNTASGTVLYTETHTKTTNAQGLFNLTIGQGTAILGTFNTINWKTNSKFLKVELDVAGGINYVVVGTTQLLSVPYAMAARSFVSGPGEGITLISPNGTPYTLSVNDSGQLSLPTTGNSNDFPSTLYMFGSFNSNNPANAIAMGHTSNVFTGFKYLTAGSTVKFVTQPAVGAAVYGVNGSMEPVLNGAAVTVSTNGFYYVKAEFWDNGGNVYLGSIGPTVEVSGTHNQSVPATYNVATNKFTMIVNGVNNTDYFRLQYPSAGGSCCAGYGDNLVDGSLEYDGMDISFPGATSTLHNYKIELTIASDGGGTYTVTQL